MRRLLALLTVLVMLTTLTPGFAQTEEEDALLERFLSALETGNSYESYVSERVQEESQVSSVVQGEIQFASNTQRNSESTIRYAEAGANIAADILLTVEKTEGEVSTAYVVDAEVRWVDEVAYFQGVYSESDENTPALPEGWVSFTAEELEASASLPDYLADINLRAVLDLQEDTLSNRPELIAEYYTRIETEEVDGLEVITMTFEGADLAALLAEALAETDPLTAALMPALSAESFAQIQLAIDPTSGLPVGQTTALQISLVDADMEELTGDSNFANAIFNLESTSYSEETFSQINELVEPTTAPDMEG